MTSRIGARLVLVLSCALLLSLGCPRQAPQIGGGTSTNPNNVHNPGHNPPPNDPPPPAGAPSDECGIDSAGRPCSVPMSGPRPYPCQNSVTGICAANGLCLFQWMPDGSPCNGVAGTCQGHSCKCAAPSRCGYDCAAICSTGSACEQGQCIATSPPACGCGHKPPNC